MFARRRTTRIRRVLLGQTADLIRRFTSAERYKHAMRSLITSLFLYLTRWYEVFWAIPFVLGWTSLWNLI